VSDRVEHQPVV